MRPQLSDVDYDKVPSPRPSSSVWNRSGRESSFTNGSAFGRRKSPFAVPSSASEDEEEQAADDAVGPDQSTMDVEGDSYFEVPDTNHRRSFSQIDQDDDDDDDDDDRQNPSVTHHQSSRPISPEIGYSQDVEHEISRGLQELDDQDSSDEMDQDPPQDMNDRSRQPLRKQPAPRKQPAKRPQKTIMQDFSNTSQQREFLPSAIFDHIRVVCAEFDENGNPLRRGTRRRYKPLEWWRCEKVVYGRRENGVSVVPVIKDIIRLPKEAPEPLGNKKKSSRSKSTKGPSKSHANETVLINPEEGWDDNTEPFGIVFDIATQQDLRRRQYHQSCFVACLILSYVRRGLYRQDDRPQGSC